MFSLMGNCVTWIKGKNERRAITLLAVGLDNAGKTTTVLGVKGEKNFEVAPTVGFSSLDLKSGQFDVKIFDLGGGTKIRGIWRNYMAESHGIIYVVDSSDVERMEECRKTFDDLISDSRLRGKPVLILANKQDRPDAIDELDLCERLNLDEVVNRNESYSRVVLCSALPLRGGKKSRKRPKLDRGIKTGFDWLMDVIARDFDKLQERITKDVEEQKEREAEERRQRIERVKRIREERERKENAGEEDASSAPGDRPRPEGISYQELPNEANATNYQDDNKPEQRLHSSGLGGALLDDDSDGNGENEVYQPPSLPGAVMAGSEFQREFVTNSISYNDSIPVREDVIIENPRALSAASLREIVRDTPTPTQASAPPIDPVVESVTSTPTLKPKAIAEIQDEITETGSIGSAGSGRKKGKRKRKKKRRIDPGSDENMSENSYRTQPLSGRLTPIENSSEISKNGLAKLPPIRNAPNFTSDVEL